MAILCNGPNFHPMNLDIEQLETQHPLLVATPIRYVEMARIALLRAKHASPTKAAVRCDDLSSAVTLTWDTSAMKTLPQAVDQIRVTEDAAEAIALAFVHTHAAWRIDRRCRRGEYADWLLRSPNGKRYAALEISGIADESASLMQTRLEEKSRQVGRSLAAPEKLAIVVGFAGVSIFVRTL